MGLPRIEDTFARFRKAAEKPNVSQPSISAWSVGKHIQHCCIAMETIYKSLEESIQPPPKQSFSMAKFAVLTFGKIPSRRANAPGYTIPKQDINTAELAQRLDETEQIMSKLVLLDRTCWFRHPVFGIVMKREAEKFIPIHNYHHLKIINSIQSVK